MPRTASRELIKLDFPTFERPIKAISGNAPPGQSAAWKLLFKNSALVIFMLQREPDQASHAGCPRGTPRNSRLGLRLPRRLCLHRPLSAQFREFLHALSHGSNLFLAVRYTLHQRLEVAQEIGIIKHCPDLLDNGLYLRIDKEVLTVGLIEQLLVDCAAIYQRSSHLPIGNDHA